MINKKRNIIICILVTAVIIGVVVLLILNSNKNEFIGTWESEGGTIYTFNKNGNGNMKTSVSNYDFTYIIKEDVISIDFKDKKAVDTDYKYYFNKNKCTLISDKGTFTFTKKDES